MTSPAAAFAIDSIGWYQRVLSPRKRFKCAYGVRHGDGTCSSIVLAAFRTRGAIGGALEFGQQSFRCYKAFVALSESKPSDHGGAEVAEEGDQLWGRYLTLEGTACCCSLPFIAS